MSGWTVDSLHELLCTKLADKDVRDQQRFEAQQVALRDALAANERRLDGMNEFRAQLADQTATLMPRREAQAIFDAQTARIGVLEDLVHAEASRRHGVSDGAKLIASVVAFVSVVLGVVISIVTLSGK